MTPGQVIINTPHGCDRDQLIGNGAAGQYVVLLIDRQRVPTIRCPTDHDGGSFKLNLIVSELPVKPVVLNSPEKHRRILVDSARFHGAVDIHGILTRHSLLIGQASQRVINRLNVLRRQHVGGADGRSFVITFDTGMQIVNNAGFVGMSQFPRRPRRVFARA